MRISIIAKVKKTERKQEMTKQQFLDAVVLATISNSGLPQDPEFLWEKAEEVWNARPKTERVVGDKKVSDSQAKEEMWKQFWNSYDKKVGTAKAKEKFLSITVEEMPSVVSAAEVYAKATPEVKYRKHPITWLNQKCWLDSLPQDGQGRPKIGLV